MVIDAGRAQLFAAADEHGWLLRSGDKRAIVAVSKRPPQSSALAGRVITLEAVLLELCALHGVPFVSAALRPMAPDGLVKICFSADNADPEDGLQSLFNTLATDAEPLELWRPGNGR